MVKMAPIASAPHVSTVPSRGFGGVGTKPCTFGEVARYTSKGPARARTLATILVLIAVLGGIAGILSNTVGLSPAVMWAVLMPNLFLVSRLLFTKRRTAHPGNPSMSEQMLLDASNTGGRVIQSLLPLVGIVLGVIGVTMLFRAGGGVGVASVAMTVAGVVLIGLPLRHVIGWDVSYKGHRIRFEKDACFGERLLIDGQLVDRGEWVFEWCSQGRSPAATAQATSSGPRPSPDFRRSIAVSSPPRRPVRSALEWPAQASRDRVANVCVGSGRIVHIGGEQVHLWQ
jgi:hypothetical protein